MIFKKGILPTGFLFSISGYIIRYHHIGLCSKKGISKAGISSCICGSEKIFGQISFNFKNKIPIVKKCC